MFKRHKGKSGSGPRRVSRRRSRLIRPMIDAASAASVFLALTAISTSATVHAFPVGSVVGSVKNNAPPVAAYAIAGSQPAPIVVFATATERSPDAVFRRTSLKTAWTLLGLSLSLLVALDLFFLRHLRRVYARSRRRAPLAQ